MLRFRSTKLLTFFLVVFSLFVSTQVEAAILSVSSVASSVSVGNIVSVKIFVNTEGKYINNAEGVLSYPVDLLEPISVSKSSSIFSLWVEEPRFNGIGSVSFNGGLPTPGYNGSSGEVVTVVFKARKIGTVSLILSDSAIRENDGLGTNILKAYKNASIQIVDAPKSSPKSETLNDVFSIRVETANNRDVLNLFPPNLLSKIDSYLIQIDNNTPFAVKSSEIKINQFTLPVQNAGEHAISVFAYDKAGNSKKAENKFSSPSIIVPQIDQLPDQIVRGNSLDISGKTEYPQSRVDIVIQNGNNSKTYTIQTQDDGSFSLSPDNFNINGLAYIKAQLVFSENVKSSFSNTLTLKVDDSTAVKTSKSFIYTLAFVIPVIVLIIILVLLVYFGWHKFFGLRSSMQNEADGVLREIHKTMDSFKNELINQLDKLERLKADRELNKKEEKIFKSLQDSVDSIDDFIDKKIRKLLK